MSLQLINEELFFVEHDQGSDLVQRMVCDESGHTIADHEVKGIQKGICLKCGRGTRFWKCSKKQTESFRKERESVK